MSTLSGVIRQAPWACLSYFTAAVCRTTHILHIVAVEGWATTTHVLPSAIRWWLKRILTTEISSYPLKEAADKATVAATLYLHGSSQTERPPTLFVHGDHGHPYCLLHLIELAKEKGPVFSLYLPYAHHDDKFDLHVGALEAAIKKIQELTGSGKIFGIGHSRGAILLAYHHFITLNPCTENISSIAGRLRVPPGDTSCSPSLESIITTIYQAILEHPERSIQQIVPIDDWNAPYEAMAVRPFEDCHRVPGMHQSALYNDETCRLVQQFLTQ